MLTVGSLFAGIGGFDLGLERTGGFRVIWQCESDPWARSILARHWPGVPCYPDVRTLPFDEVERPDVLCGGFPCQDLSQAGKGKGLEGARSGLWFAYLDAVRALRPRYVLVENVAILAQRGLDTVLAGLAASGYDAEWDCVPAAAVGAPHRRDRLWLVAYPNDGGRLHGTPREHADQAGEHAQRDPRASRPDVAHADRRGLPQHGERHGDATPRLEAPLGNDARGRRPHVADAHGRGQAEVARVLSGPLLDAARGRGWRPEPDVGRVAHGVPARVDRLRGLGNAIVPDVAEWIGRCILAREGLT